MYYAGIGSRETPKNKCRLMTKIAKILSSKYTLRSGGADGADSAFEAGAGDNKQIFLPSNYFNGKRHDGELYLNYQKYNATEAMECTWQFHPTADKLSEFAFHLHSRNAMQILGPDLNSPVDFVICWTKGAGITGGTGQALRIALHYKIPVYNLASPTLLMEI